MNNIEILRDGVCPFTGQKYNCATCEIHETLKHPEGRYRFEMCMSVIGNIKRNSSLSDWNKTAKAFRDEYGHPVTGAYCRDYFKLIAAYGAEVIPLRDGCDRFCYRHGCLGHKLEQQEGTDK